MACRVGFPGPVKPAHAGHFPAGRGDRGGPRTQFRPRTEWGFMPSHLDEHERTMAFAEIALGQIRALRQPATPRHFEIWYTYATGYNAALNQAINEVLTRDGTLTETEINRLYEIYISANRWSDRIDNVGSQVVGEIDQIMAMIGAAAGSASSYGERLTSVAQRLGLAADEPAVRAIV